MSLNTIPVKAEEEFNTCDSEYLNSIEIGCLKNDPLKSSSLIKPCYRHSIIKLREDNYFDWNYGFSSVVECLSRNRGVGHTTGTIHANVCAYQRYYGTAAGEGRPPILLNKQEAWDRMKHDENVIRTLIFVTMESDVKEKFAPYRPLDLPDLLHSIASTLGPNSGLHYVYTGRKDEPAVGGITQQ
jgi:hypothetical protein